MKDEYLTVSKLKERGWTDAKIRDWLGEPDKLKINPMYRTAPQMKLYLEKRVIKKEKSNEFIEWKEKSKLRREKQSQRMKEVMNKKREELLKYIANLTITIPKYKKDKLYSLAVEHYNELWMYRGNYDKYASIDADESFLNRISVNMLRHSFSDYEYELERLFDKVGKDEGYSLLKEKVNETIFKIYPFLE